MSNLILSVHPCCLCFLCPPHSDYSMKQIIINHFHIHGDYIAIVGNERSQGEHNDAATQPNDTPTASNGENGKTAAKDILPIPPEGKYSDVRKYIEQRARFDEEFRTFVANKSRVALCKRLSDEFGWTVDHYALGRNINRNSKR